MVVPEGLDGKEIVRGMYHRHGTVIAGSRNKLAGKVIRIGVMGHVSDGDILTDLHYLKETLQFLGGL
jgi:aspartate aminotransferase-like enzyme